MKNRLALPFVPRRLVLALAAACSLASPAAQGSTLPAGMQVVAGQATSALNGNKLTINNSNGAILNWNSFSIGAQNTVRFEQANAASQVLNRVVGNDPSNILGQLSSNGRVWLLNPNGVLFGQGARVDVAGLVTSTLRLNDSDWLAGRYVLSDAAGSNASIINQGEIRSTAGGQVFLLGGAGGVKNEGLIETVNGQLVLAAGASIELLDTAAPRMTVKVTAPQGEMLNLGTLAAAGGRIDVQAATVNQQGIVRADSLSVGPGGEIVMQATGGRLTLAEGSSTSANGDTGGKIKLLGKEIALLNGATVSADGQLAGGEILVGGGQQGKDASVPNATALFFARGASLSADATSNGDGGRIILWSNEATRAYGTLSARGGADGGNGGFIETSGGWLDARPLKIDLLAAKGRAGTWLLDPHDIIISSQVSTIGFDASFTATADNATVSTSDIQAALDSGTSVTISTGGAGNGTQAGNISMASSSIYVSSSTPGSLTLIADGSITLSSATINSYDGALNLTLTAGGAGTITLSGSDLYTSAGNITLNANAVSISGSSLSSDGAIQVLANSISLGSGANLYSGAGSGIGILLAGRNGSALSSFSNSAGSEALNASDGAHWVIFASQVQGFDSGGLAYDFKQYGAGSAGAGVGTGNGLLFAQGQTAQITGSVGSREYDGTLDVPAGSSTSSSLEVVGDVSGDWGFVDSNAQLSFNDKNAGNGKVVNVSGTPQMYDSSEMPVYGYTVQSAVTGDITQRAVVGSVQMSDKVYDGTRAATGSGSISGGLVGNETLGLSVLGSTFADKNVGTGKSISMQYTLQDGSNGGLASNYYFLPPVSTSPTASITPRPLNLQGLTANDKIYNATTSASFGGSAGVTPLSGDSVSVSGSAFGSFADKNVGQDKSVSLSGLSLAGADAGNYSLVLPTLVADITPATLTLSGLSAAGKVYDTTVTASLNGSAGITALSGDSVSLSGTAQGSFADKNVGVAKPVSVAGLSLSGADAGNYVLAAPTTLSADITPAFLLLSGLSASSKVYDSTVTAMLSGNAQVTALGNDAVSLSGTALGSFSDKNVGSGKNVILSGLSLAGADAGNYRIAPVAGLSADITPATLVVSGLSASGKVYDATVTAKLSGSASFAALGNDQLSLAGTAQGQFADKNVGAGKQVSVTGLSLAGADAANYLVQMPAGLSADITPATLLVSGLGASNMIYDATVTAILSGSASIKPLGSDQLSLAGAAQGQFADKNVGTAKPVSLSGLLLAGADAGNYQLALPTGLTADITPATLRYVADLLMISAGDRVPPLSGSVQGFVGGETLAGATTGTASFGLVTAPGAVPGAYAIEGSGLAAQNYRFVQDPGNATALTVGAPRLLPTEWRGAQTALASMTTDSAPAPVAAPAQLFGSGLVDMTKPAPAFGAVNLSGLSTDGLSAMLAERARYKRALFADAIYKLQEDPALADAVVCKSIKDAEAGTCLVTDELKREAQRAQAAGIVAVVEPAMKPAAPIVPSATASVVVPVVPASYNLPSKRRVVTAALPQIERKVAVVIGVDEYQDKTIPQLANAINDARAVGQLFESRLGYETVVIPNASKAAVISTLNKLALTIGPRDSVVIYYAGHGDVVEATGLGYWQLNDSDAKRPETWLSNNDIGKLVAQIGASQVALISDSCYSGTLVGDERIRPSGTAMDPAQVLAQKSVVTMSSGGNEPVFDTGKDGHSPFSWNFMNQLRQLSNWQAGGNVFERVRFAVAKDLPQRPRYGSVSSAGHKAGGDYLFEQRELESGVR